MQTQKENMIKAQKFLSKKGWLWDHEPSELDKEFEMALLIATENHKVDSKNACLCEFDRAIMYILSKGWALGNSEFYCDFENAIKIYRKLEYKRTKSKKCRKKI